MKLSELHRQINLYWNDSKQEYEDQEVMIVVKLPYQTVGAHPMRAVKAVSPGFDWEHGKFMIWPESDLYPSSEDIAEMFKRMERETGALYRKNIELESEIKRLKK